MWLLDTHVFLWMHLDPSRLGAHTKEILSAPDEKLFLSIGSVWEIAIKTGIGKLQIPEPAESYVTSRLRRSNVSLLPLSTRTVFEAARLDWEHRDPFDRLLIAHALLQSHTILSADRRLLERTDVVWDARR